MSHMNKRLGDKKISPGDIPSIQTKTGNHPAEKELMKIIGDIQPCQIQGCKLKSNFGHKNLHKPLCRYSSNKRSRGKFFILWLLPGQNASLDVTVQPTWILTKQVVSIDFPFLFQTPFSSFSKIPHLPGVTFQGDQCYQWDREAKNVPFH